MKKLIVIVASLVISLSLVSGCTWSRNAKNAEKQSARVAIMAAEGYGEVYELSLLATDLLEMVGTVKPSGVKYIKNLGTDAGAESKGVETTLLSFEKGESRLTAVERSLIKLKHSVMSLSAAVRAFLANEDVLEEVPE